MRDGLPPPLERIDGKVPSVSALKKGFLLSNAKPGDKKVEKLTAPVVAVDSSSSSKVLSGDVISGMEAVIRDHYISDVYMQSSNVDKSGIVSCEPAKDLGRLMERLKADPEGVEKTFKTNPQAAESFRNLMQKLGDYFESLACKESKARDPISDILNDRQVKSVIAAVRKGNRVDPRAIGALNPDLSLKLRKLINCGYLQIN